MIQESIEIERLRIAEGMYAKGEMKNVTLHARPSGREQRRKFAIRHTPGCRCAWDHRTTSNGQTPVCT